MSMHRRWFFSSAVQSLVASLAAAGSLRAQAIDPCPTLPDSPPPADLETLKKELIGFFYEGVVIGGKRTWGLDPPGTSKPLDPNRTLAAAGGHLDGQYAARVDRAHSGNKIANYELLTHQAAFLGRLTRCMWEMDQNPHASPFDVKHLSWAREALGFALNSHLQGCLQDKCGFVVIDKMEKKARKRLRPQLDQPCPLC